MKCNNCIHLQPFPKSENEFIQSVSFTVSLSIRICKIASPKVKMLRLLSYKSWSVIQALSHKLWLIHSSGQCEWASQPVSKCVSMSVYVFCCKYNVHLKYIFKVYNKGKRNRRFVQKMHQQCLIKECTQYEKNFTWQVQCWIKRKHRYTIF